MERFIFGFVIIHVRMISACLEPACTTVHIQNYDGPIYVAPNDQRSTTLCNLTPTCDGRYPTENNLASNCDNRYPSLNSLVPTYDNRYPTLGKSPTCDNRYPTLTNLVPISENQSPPTILHCATIPYHHTICETDCKCLTKHQTCVPVPVNSVPQSSCTPSYYCSQYPDCYYGYVYPDGGNCPETDVSSPRISETLSPLLKTYLSQGGNVKSTQHCCKCGRPRTE